MLAERLLTRFVVVVVVFSLGNISAVARSDARREAAGGEVDF